MQLSRFNYLSDCERNDQRLLMNFLSRYADMVDLESAQFFSERKGTLSKEEKTYIMRRGYLFSNKNEESAIISKLYEHESKSAKPTHVIHLDTFDDSKNLKNRLSTIQGYHRRRNGSLILYSENFLDNSAFSRPFVKYSIIDNMTLVTVPENLSCFEPLFNERSVLQIILIVSFSKMGKWFPFGEDIELLLDSLIERNKNVEIIVRLKPALVNSLTPMMNYFIYKGWPFLDNFKCLIEPESNEGCIFGYWYNKNLYEKIYREYEAHPQTEFCSMEKWVGINPVHSLVSMGRLSRPSFHFCEASKGLTVFTGDEEVPCLRLAGKSAEVDLEKFRKRNGFTLPECQECTHALSCGGGCSYKAVNGVHCPPVKELIEASLQYYFDVLLERLKYYEEYGGSQQ